MRGIEGLTVSDWVNDTLVNDPAIQAILGGSAESAADRIHEGIAPEGTPMPFVTFTVVEPRHVNGVGMTYIFSRIPLTVKGVVMGSSYAPLVPLVVRITELLASQVNQDASLGPVFTSERVGSVQYPEQADGIEYRHLGGLYEVQAQ